MVYVLKKKLLFIERMGQGSPLTGAGLGFLADGSQSVVVICRSTYEPGGGVHVSFSYKRVNISQLLILQSFH